MARQSHPGRFRRSSWPRFGACVAGVLATLWGGAVHAAAPLTGPDAVAFRKLTKPLFEGTCAPCHGPVDPDGGLDIHQFLGVDTLAANRESWDEILEKLRSGDMPPSSVKRPVAQIDALVQFLDAEFARVDAQLPPDSGRVSVRRLNRTEYRNTVRDWLGIDFRTDENFPADDSAGGFDNIGDVLTVSPLLMEKYLIAAEEIAERAFPLGPLPKPVQVEYSHKLQNLRWVATSTVEARPRVDYDAEYEVRIGMPGERQNGKPVTLKVWVDGKLVRTESIETKPSGTLGVAPYSDLPLRVVLSAGEHSVRAGFIGDTFEKTLKDSQLRENRFNKWIAAVNVIGPFAAPTAKSRPRLLTCDPLAAAEQGGGPRGEACVRKIVTGLAERAYRRAVKEAEVTELLRFVELAEKDGQTVEQGIALALQALLVSPHFLFHIEQDRYPGEPSRVHRVSDVELASRLSYFLWSSTPDDELLRVAMRGELSTPRVLDQQVARMLRDPKATALAEHFAGQWLEIRNLDSITPDPEKFPAWRPELREAMKTETQLFFSWILTNNRPLGEFLDARYTFLNDVLAKHYGIGSVQGPEFRKVSLTTNQRGGVLSQASVLAVSSYPTRTSIVIRGKYILDNILGTPPPPPPPDVPPLDEKNAATSASLREQMETHRANPVCASCHARMDPLGFGLENYDALGQWRATDGGLPVDASGTLPGGESFTSPAEMRQILKARLPEFANCLTEKMLTYALGRSLQRYDKPTVRAIGQQVAASGYKFQSLVFAIVHSLPFQSRRAENARIN
jgi:mono/diheme cytochrome c family protein